MLNQKRREVSRYKTYHNLKTAQSVGVIFDASQQKMFLQARNFIEKIDKRGIHVVGVGYVEKTESLDYFSEHRLINFFSIKNLTWYSKPVNEAVTKFSIEKFDILINLSLKKHLPLDYIVALSRAKFKVGGLPTKRKFYDLMINIPQEQNLNYFIQQIEHYLTVINKG